MHSLRAVLVYVLDEETTLVQYNRLAGHHKCVLRGSMSMSTRAHAHVILHVDWSPPP